MELLTDANALTYNTTRQETYVLIIHYIHSVSSVSLTMMNYENRLIKFLSLV